MIIGVFLRHYKCYKNQHFIPFITNHNSANLNVIIGKNGSGKTSILEILDVYFNKKQIFLSHDEKRLDAYIAPIICVEKSILDKINLNFSGSKSELENIINAMSDALWSVKVPSSSRQQMQFQELRDKFDDKFSRETHYLLVDGVNIDGDVKFGPFDEIQEVLESSFEKKKIVAFSNALKNSYNYIFIPVETNINDYLRLENSSIQYLIGQDVKKKIDDIFDKQVTIGGVDKKIIQIINENLTEFVNSVEKTIHKIDADYSFKTDVNAKKRVTSKDLRGKVIEEYFRNRSLKHKDTKISSMSSGQRKKALVDIIYSLITEKVGGRNDNNIIIAIDEPEASLDVTNCFEQFEKIEKISQCNIQTIVTTHWYGALPIIDNAIITHSLADDKKVPQISCFSSSNVFDNHAAHRVEDIFFKSIYDLASSILSSLRNGNKDWIVVEGHSDKLFLQSYFDDEKIKFLSIGGIDRLISLVDFLSVPLRNKNETSYTKNKIIFLSDNDLEYKSSLTENSKVLLFKRYLMKEGEVSLIDYSENKHGESTAIEDVMDSNTMWNAMIKLSKDHPDLAAVLSMYSRIEDFTISKFGGEHSFIDTDKKGNEKVKLLKDLKEILKPLKTRLAIMYREESKEEKVQWIENLRRLLSKPASKENDLAIKEKQIHKIKKQ